MNKENAIVLFKEKEIRRTWHESEWWFSVVDICAALTDSIDGGAYWRKLKQRTKAESNQSVTNCHELKLQASDGKKYKTDCANTEGILRIIQSIPSPKAEPFKRWLAKVGYERIQEIEDPELAQHRMKKLYEDKGYSKSWIDKRLRGIAIRQDLTEEWQERGVSTAKDYAILTAEISKATFGMTPGEYRDHKNLPKQSNIFTMLGEQVTTEISQQEKPTGMPENKKIATRGGSVAGNARKETEKELGRSVISSKNYLELSQDNLIGADWPSIALYPWRYILILSPKSLPYK